MINKGDIYIYRYNKDFPNEEETILNKYGKS